MPKISIRELLETGSHFGHLARRWNPKMKPFIFAKRKGIHVIDLSQTVKRVDEAYEFLKQAASNGLKIVFVGTKKQAREIVKEEAKRAGAMYITERWPGGFITNFDSVKKSIEKIREIEEIKESGEIEKLTKKERFLLNKRLERLGKLMGGVKELNELPDVLFILDARREKTAVLEANKLKIPIVAVTDSNANPNLIDYPIPANDDAIKSIKILVNLMAEAVIEGKRGTQREREVKEVIELGLSARIEKVLAQAKIKTVNKLEKLSDEEILAIEGIGKRALGEIKKSMVS